MLKDECKTPIDSSSASVIHKLNEYFGHNSDFVSSRTSSSSTSNLANAASGGASNHFFGINHFAGKVKYDARGLVSKCKDHLSKNVIECLQKSGDHFVADLFSFMPLPNGSFSNVRIRPSNKSVRMFSSSSKIASNDVNDYNGSKSVTITKKLLDRIKNITTTRLSFDANATNLLQFNVALNEVISKIESAEPVFVKCIKPNENSFSNQFVSNVAVKQIRDAGLIEYARTRKFNLPLKIDYDVFVRRYGALAKALSLSVDVMPVKDICFKIMQTFAVRNFRLGATKVFVKYEEPNWT